MSTNKKEITNKQKESTNTNTLSDVNVAKTQEGGSSLSAVPKLSMENEHSVHNTSSENVESRQGHSFMEMFASSFAKSISLKSVVANKDNKNININDELYVRQTMQSELDALHKELMEIVKEKDELLAIHVAKQGVHYVNQEEKENNKLAQLSQLQKENEETSLRENNELQENVSRQIAHSQRKMHENDNDVRNTISQFSTKTHLNTENNSTDNVNKPLTEKSKNYNEKEEENITSTERKNIVPTANEILHDAASHVHSLTTNSFVVLRSSILINYSLPNAFTLTLTPSQANEIVEIARARRSLSILEEEYDIKKITLLNKNSNNNRNRK